MNPQLWSWLLTAVGVTGLYLAGRRSPWGWAVGIGAQALWLAYAVHTRQWGFLISCAAYGWVYARNFRQWRADKPEPARQPTRPSAM
ncbi:hypothetical protein [Salinispora arenicola]|uniref:hypothetical protein n=1 Tax=Salinispora arenicola TaxID=168697 RepID=UPI00049075D8|nr:hypothetical protein [Salinispora arenicola]NIL57110.1 hypothetical protein [Salinispora arenicola]NIL62668.1 hypothetical protein [Salinispora arenicola]